MAVNTEALLAEYKELKQEQRMRMTSRDNLGYWIFPALAVIGGVALSGPGREPLLLLVPLVCIALGWAYLGNDTKVTQIGDYIRTELAPTLRESGEPMPFHWEAHHRRTPLRGVAKAIHPVVQLMIFCAPAWAALIVLIASLGGIAPSVPVRVLGACEAFIVGVLTMLFIAHGWPLRVSVPPPDPPLSLMDAPMLSLSELQNRAEQIEQDLIELIGRIRERRVPNCERICGDALTSVFDLVALLAEATAVDPRDELLIDGGTVP